MRNREEFVQFAAASALHSASNPGERKARAADAKATAEELATLFGLQAEAEGQGEAADAARWREDYERKSLAYATVYGELEELRTAFASAHLVVDGRPVQTGADVVALAISLTKRVADLEGELATAKKGARR